MKIIIIKLKIDRWFFHILEKKDKKVVYFGFWTIINTKIYI